MRSLIAVLVCCVVAATATEFRPCSGGRPAPNTVEVTGCDTLPCDFVQGTDITNHIEFTSPIDADNMRPQAILTVDGATIDFPLESLDACADLVSGQCPLSAGDDAAYNLVMPVLPEYPLVFMVIEFSLFDEGGETVMCVEIDGNIVAA